MGWSMMVLQFMAGGGGGMDINQGSKKRLLLYYKHGLQMTEETTLSSHKCLPAYDNDNLSEQTVSFNQQQLFALQLAIQNKQEKQQAAVSADCSVQAIRKKKEAAEMQNKMKKDGRITVKKRIAAQKKKGWSQLLGRMEGIELDERPVQGRADKVKAVWLLNRRVLGF